MGEKQVIIGVYSQRPLGTSKEELSYSLYHCYKPLLTYLYANSQVKFLLYISATVLEWLESDHPEINMLIADMVKKHQIEICTGGYYDPILSILPLKDRALQIEKSTTFIRKRFGTRARTLWLTDQVWSPSLISTLHSCSVDRTLLFTSPGNGLEGRSSILMQEMGRTLQVFPIDSETTNLVQAGRIDQAVTRISQLIDSTDSSDTTSQNTFMTIMLDSNVLISESMLSQNQQFIGNLSTLVGVLEKKGIKTTLPEDVAMLNQESLDTPSKGYIRAGCYRNDALSTVNPDYGEMFLHYPELNRIYGKLWYVHRLTANIKKEKGLKKIVAHELMKAESFGAFSHGSWGGLYTNLLRKENYHHLIEAEKNTREKGVFSTALTTYDLDFDGIDEFMYRGKHITAVLDPCGAAVEELDYLVTSWNYLDTFVGHRSEAEFIGLTQLQEGELQNSFINVILPPDADMDQYDKYHQQETMNLERLPFNLELFDKDNREIVFRADIAIRFIPQSRLRITKKYRFKSNSIEVEYTLTNLAKKRLRFRFGNEYNISFGFEDDEFLHMRAVDAQHERVLNPGKQFMANVKNIRMKDLLNRTMITMFSDKRFSLVKDSFRTLQRTLFGEEDMYQFTMMLPHWDIDLDSNESWVGMIGLRIEKSK